jgi:hypothetical protein
LDDDQERALRVLVFDDAREARGRIGCRLVTSVEVV